MQAPESPPRAPSLIRSTQQRDRSMIQILGVRPARMRDLYYFLVSARWSAVLGIFAGVFLSLNLVFGTAYWLAGGILNARPGSFADAYFFSVQTLATIGYGHMAPVGLAAHALVIVETMCGLLLIAVMTGLAFAKFSLPKARVTFSKHACIAVRDGVRTLMFRVANERSTHILEATLRVALLRSELTREGEAVRRLHDLELERSTSPAFVLTWTALHRITERSPLYGCTPEMLRQQGAEIIVTLTGIDSGLSQQIHARHSYVPEEILFGYRLADILSVAPDGKRIVDYGKLDDVVPPP